MLRKITITAAAMFAYSTAALSADVYESEKHFLSGAFEIGAMLNAYDQSDDDDSDTIFGVYGSAFANAALSDSFTWGLNLQGNYLNLGDDKDWDETTPDQASAIGSNLILHLDSFDLGIFGAIGSTNSHFESGLFAYQVGGLAGYHLTDSTSLFAQVGYADVRVDGDDSGFTGWFANGGAVHGFSDRFALAISGGYGYADDGYEDEDDWGEYWNVGAKAIWGIAETIPVYVTAGYDYNSFTANTEDDASEHMFKLGIAMGFGGSNSAKSMFNPYATSLMPLRAAAYGEVLD
jgi:hypothetical protein